MAGSGSYTVNRRKDASFKNFICALVAFLAMLILISILLWALRNRGSGSESLLSTTPVPTNDTGEHSAHLNGFITGEKSKNVSTTTHRNTHKPEEKDPNNQESAKTPAFVPGGSPDTTTEAVTTNKNNLPSSSSQPNSALASQTQSSTIFTTPVSSTIVSSATTALYAVSISTKLAETSLKPTRETPTAVTTTVETTTLPTTTESNPQKTNISDNSSDTTTEVVTTNINNLPSSSSQPNSPLASQTQATTRSTTPVSSTTVSSATTTLTTTLIPIILPKTSVKPTTETPTTETTTVETTTLPTTTESNPQETNISGGSSNTTTEVVTTNINNLPSSSSQPNSPLASQTQATTRSTTPVSSTTVSSATTKLTTTLIPIILPKTSVKPTTETTTTETTTVETTTLPTTTESNPQETNISGGSSDTTTEIVTTNGNNLPSSSSQPNSPLASQTQATTRFTTPVSSTTVSSATTSLTTTLIPIILPKTSVKPTTETPTTTTAKHLETTKANDVAETTTVETTTLTTTTESNPQETDFIPDYSEESVEAVDTTNKTNLETSSSPTTLASKSQATTILTKPVSSTTVSPATTKFTTTLVPTILVATSVKPATGNTCEEGVCKRAASVMLAMMNHEDNPKVCDDTQNMDYFSVICDKPGESRNSRFFKSSFRNFYKKLNESTEDSVKFFLEFYESCNKFENSVHRLNRTKALSGTGGADVTETVIKSILAESMPFFDLGLNIVEDEFVFEISLPGVNYLKTKVKGWSVVDQSKDFCIAAEAGTISQDVIELNKRSENINSCIKEITNGYINEFLIEMQELTSSLSSGKDNLEAIVKSGQSSNDLIAILDSIQESWKVYRSDKDPSVKQKMMTLTELSTKYALGFDWIAVLSKVTTGAIAGDTKVYFSEYLDQPFTTLASKTAGLKDMLDLWYSVQMYKNVVMEKQTGNLGHYCMQLTSELIPELSSHIIYELNNKKEHEELYALVDTLLNNLKTRFENSLEQAKFVTDSYKILGDRINQLQLSRPQAISLTDVSISKINGVYQDQLYQLMEHYKKQIYNQVGQTITPEILLKLFVGAFETEPKTYPPNRKIVFQPGFVSDMNKNVPYYIRVAKHGLLLAEQIAKQFIKNDFTDLASEEATLYEDLFKTLDTKYLVDNSFYTIENVKCQVEDESGNNLKYETIVGDNLAFRLATDTFLEDTSKDTLPFLADYNRNKTFLINALQDFCKPNNVADFIGDFYNKETIPAPLRIRNMAKNSQLFADTFNCKDNFERKQFPFLKPVNP
ncbi:uncharacterized protein LOC114336077 isoform X6 [Diabrotica virgifera virgifera]|uniref:Mucin-5AC-like n=1 Tax=Diabrotica virgifera virgifera TaxID=50390 RepID=A0ABM5IUB5_DIAVI|nr:uncharacterized protein LOC114336077 isoform X6 [Diabrotica virgifera virgifera]